MLKIGAKKKSDQNRSKNKFRLNFFKYFFCARVAPPPYYTPRFHEGIHPLCPPPEAPTPDHGSFGNETQANWFSSITGRF